MRLLLTLILLCATVPIAHYGLDYSPLSAAEAVPAITAQAAIDNPPAAVAAVDEQTQVLAEAIASPWWMQALAVVGGIASVIVGVARLIPGWWQPVAEFAHRYLAPRQMKEARRAEQIGNQALGHLVRTIQMVPNEGTVGELKGKILRKVPSAARDAIDERVRELEGPLVFSSVAIDEYQPHTVAQPQANS